MLAPKEKNPQPENSPQRRMEPTTLHQAGQPAQHTTSQLFPRGGWDPGHCIKQDSQPNTLPASYSPEEDGPRTLHQAGQPAQHTSSQLSSRTASPTHSASYSPEEDGTKDTASSKTVSPTHYQPAISQRRMGPTTLHQARQSAQHTTSQLFPRGGWDPGHCIKQDSQPNTLPASYSSQEDGTKDAASSRTASPTHYQRAIAQRRMGPRTLHQAGQPAQHTTSQLYRPPVGEVIRKVPSSTTSEAGWEASAPRAGDTDIAPRCSLLPSEVS